MKDPTKHRYNKWHNYGEVYFYLPDYQVYPEQARFLLLKVIEQTIRDYVALVNSEIASEQVLWEEARDLIYDNEYRFLWGTLELSFEDALLILDMDISWVREEVTRKFEERHGYDGRER